VFQYISRIKKPIAYGLLAFLILAILAIIILRPRALALYHQVKGGMILRSVILTAQKTNPNAIACDLEPVQEDSAHTQLKQAIAHLEAARHYAPKLAQTYLLLGRAFCLYGEPENAVSSYRTYVLLRPQNPLGHLELGLAYALIGESMSAIDWQTAGITPEQVLAQAEQAFKIADYRTAANRYRQSAEIKELTFADYLRWAIAATISKQEFPGSIDHILPVFPIAGSGSTKIEANYFRWLREVPNILVYGDRLIDHPGKDPTVARMWWGGDAVIIIQVPASGKHAITIRAQNTLPPPVQMNLTIDYVPVFPFEMERGDMSWQEFQTEVILSAGFHVIGLRYINNGVVNGIDRDAVIDWIEFEKIDEE